jgi:hypothetical protein
LLSSFLPELARARTRQSCDACTPTLAFPAEMKLYMQCSAFKSAASKACQQLVCSAAFKRARLNAALHVKLHALLAADMLYLLLTAFWFEMKLYMQCCIQASFPTNLMCHLKAQR